MDDTLNINDEVEKLQRTLDAVDLPKLDGEFQSLIEFLRNMKSGKVTIDKIAGLFGEDQRTAVKYLKDKYNDQGIILEIFCGAVDHIMEAAEAAALLQKEFDKQDEQRDRESEAQDTTRNEVANALGGNLGRGET